MGTSRQKFKDAAFHVLALFQVIEFGLKGILEVSYTIIKHQTKKTIPFGYSAQDFQDLPLGKLVGHLQKVNDNTIFHKQLRELIQDRNELAHKKFLHGLLTSTSEDFLEEEFKYLQSLEAKISICMDTLQNEINILQAKFENTIYRSDA